MQTCVFRLRVRFQAYRGLIAILLTALLMPVDAAAFALQEQKPAAQSEQADAKIPPEQLDSLVAPIALYPDQLLSQVLVASTYPLEIVQLQQWLAKNPKLKDKSLADAVAKQPWDPSIQSMAALPDVVKRLADDIQWTTDLGNAFLAQQSDVMDAVQRMRKKAEDTGALKSNEQQKVETKVIENKSVIIVEQAQPEVVYVPTYNPVVVYGPPVYPYPPIYYPPYPAGAVVATSMISFGVGVAVGAAWGGGWGYGARWGGNNDIDINVNNNFQRNAIRNSGNRGGNTWQHNPQHRGGAPYANQGTADRFGGSARGASASSRQAGAQQQISRQGGNVSGRTGGATGGNLGGAGVSSRAGASAGGGDRVGNRSVSPRSSGPSSFGGGGSGMSGASSRSSSMRGASSMGSRSAGRAGGGGRRR